MKTRIALALLVLAGVAGYLARSMDQAPPSTGVRAAASRAREPTALAGARTLETAHYTITSTATPAHTARVAAAAESLHHAYAAFFGARLRTGPVRPQLQIVLYRDQAQFKAHNRSRPWAEAYYLAPRSHAYYADGGPNPVHWMVHEATHQLRHELARFPKVKWVDEGLASYFGTSRIDDGVLRPGEIDPATYPVWWLPELALSGDLHEDIARGRIIPLRALITDTGPGIDRHVNQYYIGYWSLTHFLLHHDRGRYADAFRDLAATGGSLAQFEAAFGPVERVQDAWYAYLRRLVEHPAMRR